MNSAPPPEFGEEGQNLEISVDFKDLKFFDIEMSQISPSTLESGGGVILGYIFALL